MAQHILATHTDPKDPAKQAPKRPIRVMETVLRDAHQSLLATRMRTEDMLPILPTLDRVGYWSAEMWGGATFDSCLRFLREDPWERLRLIRKAMPNTRLQMLLRGQNIVGYKHYPDDIVVQFVKRAAHTGIDVFRIFDALNDLRNMKLAIETVLEAGKIAEGAISYTVSPFHTIERYVELGKELEALGCQTLCIKDMAGLLTPYTSRELVAGLKEAISIPIHLHCHATSGMAEGAYLMGIEAGADIVDVAISSMAGGTSQPPTESLVATLQNTEFDTGLDLKTLSEVAEYFRSVRTKYAHFESKHTGVDPRVLQNQIPGGMISNLANQLREQDALDKIDEVLSEVPKVRAELGYPPLVTPTSQIVGTQAVLNVIMGERYKTMTRETRNLLLGKYGKTPAPVNPELLKQAEKVEGHKAIEGRPADELSPAWKESLSKVEDQGGEHQEDDALSHAIFPQVAAQYFEERKRTGPSPDELGAAMSAIIFHLRQQILDDGEGDASNSGKHGTNPWKMAARIESLRVSPLSRL
ncbi:MAG: pyruvate carboxylase subunit B [Deltaproteobacteria bacterium]|nr:MAG: pyruvate carboxylase subunit B [Deltaproteobacteria bacterium]